MRHRTLAACAAFLFAAAAQASPVSISDSFTATNFSGGVAPVDPVTGSFSLAFDNSANATNATAGLTDFTINIATGPVGYDYSVASDSLFIGALINGANVVAGFTNDFFLTVEDVSTSPTFEFFVYAVANDGANFDSFSGALTPAATVPEPASIALVGVAVAGLGYSRRKKLPGSIGLAPSDRV